MQTVRQTRRNQRKDAKNGDVGADKGTAKTYKDYCEQTVTRVDNRRRRTFISKGTMPKSNASGIDGKSQQEYVSQLLHPKQTKVHQPYDSSH